MDPTRTLIIAGFNSMEELEEYKNAVFNPDEMLEYYIVPKSNILFLVFYDVRKASEFLDVFKDDTLNISYTISKYELPKKNEECTEKHLQSTVLFQFNNVEVGVDDKFMFGFLKPYGEIRKIKPGSVNIKIVEFYDFRDARKAFNALNNSLFGDGKIQCFWTWDIPISTRIEYIKMADEFIKKYTLKAGESVKRVKVEEKTNKNMFVALFDKFIAENILEIEKIFR